mgnify:FL=1
MPSSPSTGHHSRIASLGAAGTVVNKVLTFADADVERAKAKLLELMDAKMIVRGTERGEDGRCKYVEIANLPVQLAAAVKIVEYGLGKPTQMVVVDNPQGHRPARADLGRMLLANPSLIETVLRSMKEAAEAAQAIPVQAVASDPSKGEQESES